MTNFQRTAAWLQACGKTGSSADLSVQLGCHIEEVCELLRCLRTDSAGWQRVLERAVIDLTDLADEVKEGNRTLHFPNHLRDLVLDSLCDAEVTGNGVAYLAGFDKDSADQAVLASNDDKLIDGKPVIKPGGKIGKRPGWKAPDLREFSRIPPAPLFINAA